LFRSAAKVDLLFNKTSVKGDSVEFDFY